MKRFIAVILIILSCSACKTVPTYEEVKNIPIEELSGEEIHWGFVRKKNEAPEVSQKETQILESFNGFYMDKNAGKTLYLTFDEGYENGYTSKILDVLAQKQVKAAFFVTGPYLENQTDLIKRMIDEGHIVGNHTVNHINMAQASKEIIEKELNELNQKCNELYGYNMVYFRPPEGTYSEKAMSVISGLGYKTVLWSFAYKDWDINAQQGANYAFSQITPYLHDGAVLLLHAVSSDNAEALESVIDYARGKGYEFRSLDAFGK